MNPPTPSHAMPARPATVEQQLEHLTRVVTRHFESTGEHVAPGPEKPPAGAWERWGRWVTTGTVIAGALWWLISQSGWSPVTPKEEISKLGSRVSVVEQKADTLTDDVGDLKVDMRFMMRVVCRELVKDPLLADQCMNQGLPTVGPRR